MRVKVGGGERREGGWQIVEDGGREGRFEHLAPGQGMLDDLFHLFTVVFRVKSESTKR